MALKLTRLALLGLAVAALQPALSQAQDYPSRPIRLVVPWKYGFKGAKSIARISFTDVEPKNTWQVMNAPEYGFYANVNPKVDHPRWTQSSERRLTGGLLEGRRPTLMFNGYQEEVAHLYAGMDLAKLY